MGPGVASEHHRVPLPCIAGPLVADAAPQVDDLLPAVHFVQLLNGDARTLPIVRRREQQNTACPAGIPSVWKRKFSMWCRVYVTSDHNVRSGETSVVRSPAKHGIPDPAFVVYRKGRLRGFPSLSALSSSERPMTGDSPVACTSGSKGICHAQLLEHLGRHRESLPVDHSGTGVVSRGRSVVSGHEDSVSELPEPVEGPPRLPDDDGLADDLLPA